jgi:hypothetical protein
LQILTFLTQILKSGEIDLSTGNKKLLQLTVKTKQIDLNIVDNKLLKELSSDGMKIKSFRELLRQLKSLAEELKSEGVTVTISYKSTTVLTLGSGAKPNFSQLITGTTEIEVNNLTKLIQMGLS